VMVEAVMVEAVMVEAVMVEAVMVEAVMVEAVMVGVNQLLIDLHQSIHRIPRLLNYKYTLLMSFHFSYSYQPDYQVSIILI